MYVYIILSTIIYKHYCYIYIHNILLLSLLLLLSLQLLYIIYIWLVNFLKTRITPAEKIESRPARRTFREGSCLKASESDP